MDVLARLMSRLIRDDLHMKAYHQSTGHLLTTRLKQIRLKRCKRLLQRRTVNGHESIHFTDEQTFTVEKVFNKQNDKIHANTSKYAKNVIARDQRGHHTVAAMVWFWGKSVPSGCVVKQLSNLEAQI